jgi:hypothetical protein
VGQLMIHYLIQGFNDKGEVVAKQEGMTPGTKESAKGLLTELFWEYRYIPGVVRILVDLAI